MKFPLFESFIEDTAIILGEDKEKARKELFRDLKKELSDVTPFNRLDDFDWDEIYDFFDKRDATSVLLADESFFKFIKAASSFGFPMTRDAAVSSQLKTARFNTDTILSALVGAGVLSVFDIPAVDALKTSVVTRGESEKFKKEPTEKVRIYDYSKALISNIGRILSKLDIKKQGTGLVEHYEGKKDANPYSDVIDEVNNKMSEINRLVLAESTSIDDEMLEGFVDAILLHVAELERTGRIEPIMTAEDAKDIVLSVIKKMHKKQGVISKMSAKFARFGSKRALIAGMLDISRALK